jgi:hypothetical protein
MSALDSADEAIAMLGCGDKKNSMQTELEITETIICGLA